MAHLGGSNQGLVGVYEGDLHDHGVIDNCLDLRDPLHFVKLDALLLQVTQLCRLEHLTLHPIGQLHTDGTYTFTIATPDCKHLHLWKPNAFTYVEPINLWPFKSYLLLIAFRAKHRKFCQPKLLVTESWSLSWCQ